MIGKIYKNTPISAYQPSQDVAAFTAETQRDYNIGTEILNKPWVELNNRSVIEDANRGQMMFNAFVDESVEDPNEAWKWRGTRSMARNKGIVMHANLTGNYILPAFTAQNENDELDRDFSEVMRDIAEWMASPLNSDYQSSFLQIVFGMMQNPATYMGAEYAEIYQTIKEKQEDGRFTTKEILDEVLSGFQAPIYSVSQILITNAYERNIQKQRRIIKRRFAEKSELEAKYGHHKNWIFVREGIQSIYNSDNGLFYDIKDDAHPFLVAEETVLSRRDDSEVCFVNGIYMGNENIDDNPMRHRDQNNAPKYNVVPFGYSRIGTHFFYYKSMMNCVGWDNMLYDAMSEVVMNQAFLEVERPIVVSGSDKVDSEIVFPGSIQAFEDPNVKITPMLPNSNMASGFNALRETEKSITEGTVNETISGQLPEASQKAYSVAQAQANAKKLIGGVGKSLGESIILYDDLMKDIIIHHITAPEVEELTAGNLRLKYTSFILQGKSVSGKMSDKRITFDESLIGKSMSNEEKTMHSLRLLEKTGYPDDKETLILVNPELFAKCKYLVRVDTEEMFAKNQEYWQPVLTNLLATLAQNPFIDQEKLTRKTMYAYFQSEGDDFIKKQSSRNEPISLQPQGNNQFGQMVQNKQLAGATMGAV